MQPVTLAIAADFTAEPVLESVQYWMDGLGLHVNVDFAPFDQLFQQLLDPTSLFGANSSGVNAALVKLDVWLGQTDDRSAVDDSRLEKNVEALEAALRTALSRAPTPHVVLLCPADPNVLADHRTAGRLAAAEETLLAAFRDASNVQVVASREILATHPAGEYYDHDADSLGQTPYTESFYAALGTVLARRVRAALGSPYKVIALDCDNTLWRGVVGELGATKVEIDAPMRALQELMVRQHEAGVLLCLCSKNNEADVEEVFRQRTDMPLAWDHIVRSRINWEPKSENLKSLAAELNLGLDSFIFIDDSPYEIAEVRQNCPEVLALQLPADPEAMQRFVVDNWLFDRTAATSADRTRAASYKQNLQREGVLKQAGNLEEFLRDLELEVDIRAPAPDDLARAAQMTQRTNQFNLSTRRRTEAELGQLFASGALECRIASVRDRFGDYGVVGLLLFDARESVLRVDTFLLSCRALGRRVEHRMLAQLGSVAHDRGIDRIELPFIRTQKNTPALRFLNSLGGDGEPVSGDHTFTVTPEGAIAAPTLAASSVDAEGAAAAAADNAKLMTTVPTAVPATAINGELIARIYTDLYDPMALLVELRARKAAARPVSARTLVGARNDVEAALLSIWRDVLRQDAIGVTDNFFDLGGNSLAAVPMFVRLRKQFKSTLSPTTLLDAPTIEQLAALITASAAVPHDASASTSMLALNREGTLPPLFLVHAGAGTVFVYYPLASALGKDQPVYAFQAQGIYSEDRPHTSLVEMAAHYISEMRALQPHGPYRLAGFCLGATIAFEMACQLERAGEQISFLGSLDGVAPQYRGGTGKKSAQSSRWKRARERVMRKARQIRNRWLFKYTSRRGGPIPRIFQRQSWYFLLNNHFAKMRYSPAGAFSGDIHVFTIQGRYPDPTLGWSKWVRGVVQSHEVAGEFRWHRDLTRRPMIDTVAAELRVLLDDRGATSSKTASALVAAGLSSSPSPLESVMRTASRAVLALLLALAILPSVSRAQAPRTLGIDTTNFDRSVRPQDDLFRFVSGGWLKANPIPPDAVRWGAFNELDERSRSAMRAIIEDASRSSAPAGSEQRKIGDLYASFMDSARVESLGFTPLKGELATIGAITATSQLPAAFAHFARLGVARPIGVFVGADQKQSTRNIVQIGQSGLGLPDRDYYLNNDARMTAVRQSYHGYITQLLTLAQQPDPAGAATRVIALETAIAGKQWDRARTRDRNATYNPMTVAQLVAATPHFDWNAYLAAAGLGAATNVIVAQPDYLTAVDSILTATPVSTWRELLTFRLLDSFADELSSPFVQARFAFRGKVLSGQQAMRPRWKRGVSEVEGGLGEAAGRLYVARYFKPEAKARMDALIKNLLEAYRIGIDSLEWMTPETKTQAKAKLAGFTVKIAYPDKWRDYGPVTIRQNDLIANVMSARAYQYQDMVNQLAKPVDKTRWGMTPQTVNAYYSPTNNEIVFPAAILQPPFFDPDADDAVNYGGIGAVIGHEIGHGFDDQGRKSDGSGNLRDWWTSTDAKAFDERASKLGAQYDALSPVEGMHVNGKLTMGENIGDLSGLAQAYRAYRLSLHGKEAPVIGGFTGDQRFFMGFAQIWRANTREEAMRQQLLSDPHSPGQYRAYVPLVNNDAFQRAFDVKPGDKMYRAPSDRVRIW